MHAIADPHPAFSGSLYNIRAGAYAHDERNRAETQLAGERRLLEMVATGCALTEILVALCGFVEGTAADCYCSVYLVDWRRAILRNVAAPSLPASFNDPSGGLSVVCETGPYARAACLRTQVVTEDIESDPLWQTAPFRALALAHGLRSCWSTPIYSAAGQVLGIFTILQRQPARPTPFQQGIITYVTRVASIAIERAHRDAALERSTAFLAEAQRLGSAGSFSWYVATDEITWSEQIYRIFEFDPAVPVTLARVASRVHPEDTPRFHEMIALARANIRDFECEYRLLMPDQSIRYLRLLARAVRHTEGELEYIGAAQDVTHRRASEEALSKARSELAHVARVMSLGALTASIAHEVNQPLSGIVTNASTCLRMLAAETPDVDGARETARRTLRDANRASEVITRLRALFAKKVAATEAVDLNEATREVISLSLCDLQRRRLILRSELADDLPWVAGDRVQLQQVVLNLLLNAADAMSGIEDRPRQLLIRTEAENGERVRLSVQDLGIGLGAKGLPLFEPFYTTKSEGMGIGLSVSRFIIESHHGRLWATPNEGPGATFSFSIPCRPRHVARNVM